MRARLAPLLLLAACGGGDDEVAIDAARLDAATDARLEEYDAPNDASELDAPDLDAPDLDAANAVPLPGFGDITGMCGVLDDAVFTADQPVWYGGDFHWANRYDDPAERDQLTAGGLEIILDGNAGGSSLYSEVFAYEWLARCELATLLKTETEILYDVNGKKADLLVEIDGRKVGVSVTRAVTFPFGDPYTPEAATTLFERKLDDLQLATTQVSAADLWSEQMVVALAIDTQHAQVAMDAWNALDAQTRGQAIMIVAVTTGDAMFIYTDN